MSVGLTGLSRYESDFQELRSLGKGGYGVVVAAVNRLDGRQYAVKKIRMLSQSPQGFSRLIREVTTLSRLQHRHVVRYFQVSFCSCSSTAKHPYGYYSTAAWYITRLLIKAILKGVVFILLFLSFPFFAYHNTDVLYR